MEEEGIPRLLRVSHHASATSQRSPSQISPRRVSWLGKFISGLGQWWGNPTQSNEMQLFQKMVVSDAGTQIAVLDGYQITFFSKANAFEIVVGSSINPLEAGFYICGVWLEDLEVFAAMSSLKCIISMDNSGKELSRTSLNLWKTNAQTVGMFARQMQNVRGGQKYSLAIYSSDCSIYQIEYGPEGFCGIGSEVIIHTLMKKMHPKEVICCDFNGEKSILALAGLSTGNRFTRSAGTYCVSLWRTKDFWRPVELLGYISDLKPEDCSVSTGLSLKLILSPACNYIGLLDSGSRLYLFNLQQSPNWTLQKIECQNIDTNEGLGDANVMNSRQADSQSKFLVFEVSSVCDSNASQFESLNGVREACWWSENALALSKHNGVFAIVSVPDLQLVSKFCCGVSFYKMYMTYATQRCIFVLESFPGEQQQKTMTLESVVDLKRSGWRLVTMQEYTVIQLFETLLESADFDFALNLADRYKLGKDTVYKRQWLLSNWDLESVRQILPKIEDRSWVLNECLKRVCPSMEAMHALLRHGLDLVDLCVGNGRLKCAAQDAALRYFTLSRLRLLQYSDRLETYLGLSLDRYTSKDYEVFRLSPLLDVAVRLAELGKTGAVSLLYKRHVYSLVPFLFTILDAFPETLSPHSYAQLLPASKPYSPHVIGREKDWVEEDGIVEIIHMYDVINEEAPMVHLSSSTEHVVNACIGFVWPSETDIVEWYCKRACTIDRVSGQLENALTLLDLGKQKGLCLEDLWEDLSSLHWVTYNNSEDDEGIEVGLSIHDWQQLTDYEKFEAMLQGVNESNVLFRLNDRAVPFLNYKTRRKAGTLDRPEQEGSFLVKWMKESASKDQLRVCATILTEACKDFDSNNLFKSELEYIYTGLDCVYACPGVDQWDAMDTILSKLVEVCSKFQANSQIDQSASIKGVGEGAARGVSFSMHGRLTENISKRDNGVGRFGKEGVYAALDRKIRQAIGHVDAGRLLSNYQVAKPIKFLENAQNDERGVKQLILSMLSKFGRRQPPRSDSEWAAMWDHLQRLQAEAFTFLNRQFLFMEYYSSLLRAGKFALAKSLLKGLGNNLLSPERVEAVIIQVSRDYLFSASSLDSTEIEKARLCLNLVPESKSIVAELDYIDTLTKKLPALGVSLLPMQVKQTKDPMEIVRRALMTCSSTEDLQVDDVMHVARSLGMNSEDQIADVKEAIARQAAASGQIELALDFVLALIRRGHGAIWDFCAALARGPELDGMSLQLRKELLGFSISHCDDASIGQLLQTWKEIDLFERSTTVKEAMTVEASSAFFFEENLRMESEYHDLQHQGLVSKVSRQLLCKVAHIGTNEDLVDESLFSKDQKKILHILCSHLPWLLQVADVESQKVGNWQQDDNDLVSKSVATILLGLAHGNIIARDELLCLLAHMAMLRLSKDRKSMIGCGYLLNLLDSHRATALLEQEMQHVEELTESCKILNVSLKYGSLLQEDAVRPTTSPKSRRERLLMTLRQSKPSLVSGVAVDSPSGSEGAFWRHWQSKVLKRLDTAEHALELKPIITNFKKDQFISGAESYVKDTVISLVKSATVPKSFEPQQVSRVDRYQSPIQIHDSVEEEMKVAKIYSLNFGILENKLKSFNKYLKNRNVEEIWLSIETLMTATAMAVLEEQGGWYEDEWKERLCNLLHFWVHFFEGILDDESLRDALSRQAVEALLQLRVCCENLEKLMQNNTIPGLQSREVIAALVNFQGCEEKTTRFLKAMVSSACPYQTVLFVWQNTKENMKCDSSSKIHDVSNIYVHVISSSIETCAVLCKSLSFDGCCHHLDPTLKAVASLSKLIESDDEILQQGLVSLHEVRLCVWKTICHFTENLDVPAFLRAWLFKLREAIVSGPKKPATPHSFESSLKNLTVSWVGWDTTGLAGEATPPLQQTIMALKSTEFIATVWHNLTIDAQDLVSVEAATSLFERLSANVEHYQHVHLLITLLEEWGEIFGWVSNASQEKTTEHLTNEEENEHMDVDWGQADGWDDIWDVSEEVTGGNELVNDSGKVNALHACWKSALVKLISFGEIDLLLHALDSAHLRNGRTILTKEETLELISLFAQEDPASALKVSLLLPYKEVQDQALKCFDNKIRNTGNIGQEMEGSGAGVDDSLLILILASGRFSAWIDDLQFSAAFRSTCAALASAVQTGQFSSAFTRDVVLPYFVASLTPTSQYTAACALVLQSIRVHPTFITWNCAHSALDKFLRVKASMPNDDLNNISVQVKSLSCINNSVRHLQTQLTETLCSALEFLSNLSS